jgi:hypothetical protein
MIHHIALVTVNFELKVALLRGLHCASEGHHRHVVLLVLNIHIYIHSHGPPGGPGTVLSNLSW